MTNVRYRGSMLGLAVGDAVGTTLEFSYPGEFEPIQDMIGGGPFGLQRGQWTDDTSMALCLAESLLACRGFDPVDQLRRYVRWWREGYMSSTGSCFDIGMTTRASLATFEKTGQPYCGPTEPETAGNGSLMRLAPIALFFARSPMIAIGRAVDSSRTTHGATTAIDACRYFAGLILGALEGESKKALTSPYFGEAMGWWQAQPLAPEIADIWAGSFRQHNPPEIRGSGWVVHTLEAALWAFHHTDNFRDGCLRAVNLGEDSDTTGAVFGQLAGAFYGEDGIPLEWRAHLHAQDMIARIADRLHQEGPSA